VDGKWGTWQLPIGLQGLLDQLLALVDGDQCHTDPCAKRDNQILSAGQFRWRVTDTLLSPYQLPLNEILV
jgi:hypothetical protein